MLCKLCVLLYSRRLMCSVIVHVGSPTYQGDICNDCFVRRQGYKMNFHAYMSRVSSPCQRGPHLGRNGHYCNHAVRTQCIFCLEPSLQATKLESGKWCYISTWCHMAQEGKAHLNLCSRVECNRVYKSAYGVKSTPGAAVPHLD